MRGVTVRAEDQLSGQHHRLFAQHLVADAAPDLKEIFHALLCDEVAHLGVILRMLRRRRRHGVIERDAQPIGVFHALDTELFEQTKDGGGIVMAQNRIRLSIHDLSSADAGLARRAGQGFFGKCFSHNLHFTCAQ